jgi:polyphosphate kinase
VKIDLVVRSACSLVPGIKGISENIKVISIVDRYLEHSRIYYFQNASSIYLCSADWMPRNFFSRLEIAYPIIDGDIAKYFTDIIIPGYMRDTVKARELTNAGIWSRRRSLGPAPHRAQTYFESLAKSGYKDTPLFFHRFSKK